MGEIDDAVNRILDKGEEIEIWEDGGKLTTVISKR